MGRTKKRFGWLAGLAAVLALAPAAVAEAPPAIGAINAVDFAFANPATGQGKVVIAPGGSVDFAYPSGANTHNVVFTGNAPTSCTQTAGANSGAVPPLPAVPTAAGWAGNCRFDAEGTYAFVCGLHGYMNGSVVVSSTLPAEDPKGDGPGPSGGGKGGGGGADGGSSAASQPTVARVQRGTIVRGSVKVAGDGSRLVVDVLARRSALGGEGGKQVRVGRLAKSVAAGKRSFAVKLGSAARRAVEEAGRLAVSVQIVVRPASGAAFSVTKPVTVKALSGGAG